MLASFGAVAVAVIAFVGVSAVPAGATSAAPVWIGRAENGTRCQAGGPGPYDAVQGHVHKGAPRYTVPAGGTQVAAWKTDAGADGGTLQLEVWRKTATAGSYQLVGISPTVKLKPNVLRVVHLAQPIPVLPGDLLGVRQISNYLACGTITANKGDEWATNHSGGPAPTPGATETLTRQADLELNIAAKVDR